MNDDEFIHSQDHCKIACSLKTPLHPLVASPAQPLYRLNDVVHSLLNYETIKSRTKSKSFKDSPAQEARFGTMMKSLLMVFG